MSEAALRNKLERVADKMGLVISPFHEHKIASMVKSGHCDCDPDRNCPCKHIKEDVKEWGSCLCRVLVTPERLKKQEAYYNKKRR